MKRFKIILEGHGYFLTLSDRKESVGFFTTFLVSAKSLDEIRSIVVERLKARLSENNIGVVSNLLFTSYSTIEAIYLLEENEPVEIVDGFSFYTVNFLRRVMAYVALIYFKIFWHKKLIIIDPIKADSVNF
jgi:hypothetical protein